MPNSSAAFTGIYSPTHFYTHKTKSGKPIESVREVFSPQQIQTDVSNIENVPTVVKKSKKLLRFVLFGLVALIICGVAASIVVPILLTSNKLNESQSSSTTQTTITTTTETTTTQTTTTSDTTTTTTSSSTSSTSTTTTSSTTSSSTSTTTTTETTTTTTSINQSPSRWPFDGNLLDSISIFNGIAVNSPTYQNPGINGYGSALSIVRANNQYVNVPTYRNLTYQSFTVSLWFYWTLSSSSDFGLFGQFHSQANDQSLHYQIRNNLLQLAFFNDDLMGNTSVQTNQWYHVAFVYDYITSKQSIYLNGINIGIRSSAPYQGTSGDIVIGKTEQIPGAPNYFNGYIDEMWLVMRTKSSSEIFDEATLVTLNTFDNNSPYQDSGPLKLLITTNSTSSVSGRVNQAISFTTNSSYYQIYGFVLLGIGNNPYSMSIWIYPLSLNGSMIVHISSTSNGQGWCIDSIGISSSGRIIIHGWNSSIQTIIGPFLNLNSWTHIVNTYSYQNGHRLYINGTFFSTTGPVTYSASNVPNYITLGNSLQGSLSCTSLNQQAFPSRPFLGYIDEFRVYSRELNQQDINSLANP